ncbi:hypothetical protein N0V85_001528 [Neurospora sp. IMI 360204]|nr:hypothetical protein N0V85_001528 [Neurospora sp. IMI 360204]
MPDAPIYPNIPESEGCALHVTIYIDPNNVKAFFEAYRHVYDKVISEKECTFFSVYQNPEDPEQISWIEHWTKNPEWLFKNQFTKEYYGEYLKVTEAMFVKPREIKWFKMVEGYTTVKEE